MMTSESMLKRAKSVSDLRSAVSAKSRQKSNIAHKLLAFNTLFEPPASIRKANSARAMRLFDEIAEMSKLEDKLERESDKLFALPTISTYESYDGTQRAIVIEGLLPDFEKTSTDEQTALKMLNDYYARNSA